VSLVLLGLGGFVVFALPMITLEVEKYVSTLIVMICGCGVCVNGLRPVLMARAHHSKSMEDLLDVESLIQVLHTPQGFASFQRFLALEFSSENLIFWDEVTVFKTRFAAKDHASVAWKVTCPTLL
jgi:hypothetical protein